MLDVIEIDAANPGPPGSPTGSGNRTYLLVSDASAVLIDAGVGRDAHLASVARALAATRSSLASVVVTHDHADHIAGVPAVHAAYPAATFAKRLHERATDWGVEWRDLRDGEVLRVGGEAVTILHTPGHAPDHLALWHEAGRALFAGDLVIAGASVMIPASRGGSLIEYLHALDRVLELRPRRIYPAHGPVIDDPEAVLRAHLEHRRERERQVVAAVRAGRRTVEAIAESIYDGLDARLMPAARDTVQAHLDKLALEGTADNLDGWRLL
jgi:glyoxylase-like metal-dependent hydrolase (beta-lactamase superfamily II)